MINFRYHVVSLTAVFFALAIGLVVGTAALNGPAVDSLRDQVITLGQQNQELRDRVNHLNDDVNAREQFAEEIAPVVLANKLTGRSALVIFTPSGEEYVDRVADMLTTAGAGVNGRIGITDKFLDPASNDALLDLSHTAPPPSIAPGLPTNADGVESSAALLGIVLHRRVDEVPPDDRRRVLEAYQNEGYLAGAEEVTTSADVIVVVSGPPMTDKEPARRNAAVLTLVAQLDQTGSLVVAASSDAGNGNVVAETRGDPKLQTTISTVDNIGTPQGLLVMAWAAADQIGGKVGHYGIGADATLIPATTE